MRYTVVEVVIDKLVTTLRLREWQYDIEEIVEHIAEALRLIGASKVYEEKVHLLTFTDKYALLPHDHINTRKIVPECTVYRESGSAIEADISDGGTLELHYQALPLDERGYILVPDSTAVREALMWYLIKILTLQREITHINFQMAEQEWQWRCASARADLNVPSAQTVYGIYKDYTSFGVPRKTDPNSCDS